jgi:hypothetical protein
MDGVIDKSEASRWYGSDLLEGCSWEARTLTENTSLFREDRIKVIAIRMGRRCVEFQSGTN